MPRVPEFGREVKLNGTALKYEGYNLTSDMFGGSQAKALMNMAQGANNVAKGAMDLANKIDDAKMLELSKALIS